MYHNKHSVNNNCSTSVLKSMDLMNRTHTLYKLLENVGYTIDMIYVVIFIDIVAQTCNYY